VKSRTIGRLSKISRGPASERVQKAVFDLTGRVAGELRLNFSLFRFYVGRGAVSAPTWHRSNGYGSQVSQGRQDAAYSQNRSQASP
jgi:hypothetical protein